MGHLETNRRRLQSTTTVIDDDDILIEILLRLPTKSVIQLKSICKRWRSLISGHYFSVLHTLRHATTTAASALILHRRRYKYHYISLQQPNRSIKTPFTFSGHVIQSCHGLLLCRFTKKYGISDYYIYNLATRVYRILNVECAWMEGLAIAFDPSKSAHYKLIRVKFLDYVGEEGYYQIDAFDSKSSSWSIVIEKLIGLSRINWYEGIYWNNAIHWMMSGGSAYVDLDKGVFGESPEVSAIYWRRYSQGYIGPLLVESGCHLHFMIHDISQCSIFELEKDYSTWSIKYHVEYGGIEKAFPVKFLLGVVRAQSDERSFLLFSVPGKLMAYNLSDKSFVELIELIKEGCYGKYSLMHDPVHQFVATLAPV